MEKKMRALKSKKILGKLEARCRSCKWNISDIKQQHECNFLYKDASKARRLLQWQAVWDLDDALNKTAKCYQALFEEKK
jgi:hypothetical protein